MEHTLVTKRACTGYALWLVALLPLFALGGCATTTVPALVPDEIPRIEAAGNYQRENYKFEPGDTIQISYTFHPEMNQTATVQPDGTIITAMVGEIPVSGMTLMELRRLLVERTSDRLRDPDIIVAIDRFAEKNVFVLGEVVRPGAFPYQEGLTPLQAIAQAVGFKETARLDSVILIRKGWDNTDFVARKLNLAETVQGGVQEPLQLAPHDILFVPMTNIAKVNLWVRQHFTEMIRGVPTPRYSFQ